MIAPPDDALAVVVSLTNVVYQRLLDAITRLELAPGERLIESRIASQLGVSRLPVRQAIWQLAQQQLVVVRPRRGACVAPLTTREASEIYTLRVSLEALAARLAAQNAGGEQIRRMEAFLDATTTEIDRGNFAEYYQLGTRFHAEIVAASGNGMLATMLDTIGHHVARLRSVQLVVANQETVDVGHRKHREIFQAIVRRQASRAGRLMEEHIATAREQAMLGLGVASPASPQASAAKA